ncbi:hypothetical protein NDA18_001061 [Ustilago nuda]|nr:hypothetical protein NDA18_001061 [Ustilago nuda]
MKIAIQGCSHGELDSIYASLLRIEREQSIQIDALLLCGDFQAIRNHSDLHAIARPAKYRQLGTFHPYYSGQKLAPILTLVIGGNHEASNYMHELFHGGWLAPNIYFLGAAGVVELNGLLIGGISGIWKRPDYKKGRYERLPYDAGSLRSAYHTREFDVVRLMAMGPDGERKGLDVMLSHDWPNTIEQWGDKEWLVKKKPFFKEEVEKETLGSPPLMDLLKELKPKFWFSAHLHVKFPAIYNHDQVASGSVSNGAKAAATERNPEAIDIDLDSDNDDNIATAEKAAAAATSSITANDTAAAPAQNGTDGGRITRFLALHKCLPLTPFLQILDLPSPYDLHLETCKTAANHTQRIFPTLRYNKRWLAITRAYHPHFSLQYRQPPLPSASSPDFLAQIEAEERWIDQNILSPTRNSGKRKQDEFEGSHDSELSHYHGEEEEEGLEGVLDITRMQRFIRTAPAPFEPGGLDQGQPRWYTNPQTEAFCRLVGIENKINPRPHGLEQSVQSSFQQQRQQMGLAGVCPHPHHTQTGGEAEVESETADPNALAISMDDLDTDSEEAIQGQVREALLTLSDDDERDARWKEGTG